MTSMWSAWPAGRRDACPTLMDHASPHDLDAVHGDHEPTPSPSKEGSRTAWPGPLLGGVRGGFVADGGSWEAKPERCSCRWGARSSRPLPSASRRRSGNNHLGAPFSEWNLSRHLFGETPNRATGTVALPFFDCIVPAKLIPPAGCRQHTLNAENGAYR